MCNVSVDYGKKSWDKATCNRSARTGIRRYGVTSRKTIPYEFTVMGLDAEKASELFLDWVEASERCGASKIGDSEFECTFDEVGRLFKVKVSYPKDFDLPVDAQRSEVRTMLRTAARQVAIDK